MKVFFKKLVEKTAGFLTRRILRRRAPIVVGVTGSMGKTSAKDAIYEVLRFKFSTNKSRGNLNSELGLPLAVAGYKESSTSASFWLKALLRLFGIFWQGGRNLEDILVLEMAADKPGDIGKLVAMAPPQIGVVTNVSISHLEFFKRIDQIVAEKRKMVESLDPEGFAVLCGDDDRVKQMGKKTRAQILTYGLLKDNLVRATNVVFNWTIAPGNEEIDWGMSFKLNYKDNVVPVRIRKALGVQQVYAALAGACCGISLGMNLVEISEALTHYRAPKGRLRVLKGRQGSIILDDSYNSSSPISSLAALDVLEKLGGKRKIAVLGDMLELGSKDKRGHKEVGRMAAEVADVLLTFGESSELTAQEASQLGGERLLVKHFFDQQELVKYLLPLLKDKVVVLVKGSQGMRMEKVVEAILAEPEKARKLLVRQSEEWLNK